jgi:hypothetical protein
MLRATTFLVAFVLILPTSAQEPPKTDFGFDPKTIPAADPAYGPSVARVFGKYIYLAQAGEAPRKIDQDLVDGITSNVWHDLQLWLIEKERITATPQEIEQVATRMRLLMWSADPKFEFDLASMIFQEVLAHWMGACWVTQWKIDRLLYQRYGGGTVIFQQFSPQEPVGAHRCFLEEAEAAKAIEFYDPEVREKFWKYYLDEDGSLMHAIPSDEVDFDQPWWLKPADFEQ